MTKFEIALTIIMEMTNIYDEYIEQYLKLDRIQQKFKARRK
jgi:hypothetical protein